MSVAAAGGTGANPVRLETIVEPERPVPNARAEPARTRADDPAVTLSLTGQQPERVDADSGLASRTQPKFAVDRETQVLVFQVVDQRNGAVVLQLPDEAQLRRRAYEDDGGGRTLPAAPERLSRLV